MSIKSIREMGKTEFKPGGYFWEIPDSQCGARKPYEGLGERKPVEWGTSNEGLPGYDPDWLKKIINRPSSSQNDFWDGWSVIEFNQSKNKKMKRSEIRVKVNTPEEAKLLMAVLSLYGENIASNFFDVSQDQMIYGIDWGSESGRSWTCFRDDKNRHEIPIKEFIEIISGRGFQPEVEKKEFILTSQDGFRMLEGEGYYLANRLGEKWILNSENVFRLSKWVPAVTDPKNNKAFKSYDLALKWVEEQNKPYSIKLACDTPFPLTVKKSGVTIDCSNYIPWTDILVTKSEIMEIVAAFDKVR